jgi:ABC-type lipopolysaccharide export system ATPase subunit
MLLDEPFAGVDPISVLDIQRIIRHLSQRGIGVLITDHNVRETLGICGHAYIVNERIRNTLDQVTLRFRSGSAVAISKPQPSFNVS